MSSSASQTSLSEHLFRPIPYWLRSRLGVAAVGTGLAAPALWFGWPWLVAAGLTPLVIVIAPCTVMCGLSVCAMKARPSNRCPTKSIHSQTDQAAAPIISESCRAAE